MKNSLNATRKGLIIAGLMIVTRLILFYGLKLPVDNPYQNITFFIYAIGLAWVMLSFSIQTTSVKFSDYFSNGFKAFVVISLLMVAYTLVFYVLHPEIRQAQIELNNQLLIQEGNHTAPEIEANAKQMKSIFIPMTLLITTFLYLFLGSVITLLYTVIILQKKKKIKWTFLS